MCACYLFMVYIDNTWRCNAFGCTSNCQFYIISLFLICCPEFLVSLLNLYSLFPVLFLQDTPIHHIRYGFEHEASNESVREFQRPFLIHVNFFQETKCSITFNGGSKSISFNSITFNESASCCTSVLSIFPETLFSTVAQNTSSSYIVYYVKR